jgi:uncharacterized protein YkwD
VALAPLGALGQAARSPPSPRRRTLDPTQPTQPWADEPAPPDASAGRHRALGIGRLGPIGLAAVVAAVLVMFGIGAIVVPALLSGGSSTAPPPAAAGPDGAEGGGESATPTVEPTTGPTASPRPTRTPKVNIGRYEDMVVDLVNDERQKAGCDRVRNDDNLHDAARAHSTDMAEHDFFSHTGSDRSSPQERMRDAGYRNPLAENIAAGYSTPQDVMDAMMRDRGHRELILNCHAKAIGVGLAFKRDGTAYWTQDFGR